MDMNDRDRPWRKLSSRTLGPVTSIRKYHHRLLHSNANHLSSNVSFVSGECSNELVSLLHPINYHTISKEPVNRANLYLHSIIRAFDRDDVPTARQPLGIEYNSKQWGWGVLLVSHSFYMATARDEMMNIDDARTVHKTGIRFTTQSCGSAPPASNALLPPPILPPSIILLPLLSGFTDSGMHPSTRPPTLILPTTRD